MLFTKNLKVIKIQDIRKLMLQKRKLWHNVYFWTPISHFGHIFFKLAHDRNGIQLGNTSNWGWWRGSEESSWRIRTPPPQVIIHTWPDWYSLTNAIVQVGSWHNSYGLQLGNTSDWGWWRGTEESAWRIRPPSSCRGTEENSWRIRLPPPYIIIHTWPDLFSLTNPCCRVMTRQLWPQTGQHIWLGRMKRYRRKCMKN